MNTKFTSLLILVAGLYSVEGCGSKNIECKTSSTFRFCFIFGGTTIYVNSIELSCSEGTICDENVGAYACIDGTDTTTTTTTTTTTSTTTSPTTSSTTTTESTTTALTVSEPDCSVLGAGKYAAAACNQYYECSAFLWWFNLNLNTCASGQAFDASSQTCVANSTCTA